MKLTVTSFHDSQGCNGLSQKSGTEISNTPAFFQHRIQPNAILTKLIRLNDTLKGRCLEQKGFALLYYFISQNDHTYVQ